MKYRLLQILLPVKDLLSLYSSACRVAINGTLEGRNTRHHQQKSSAQENDAPSARPRSRHLRGRVKARPDGGWLPSLLAPFKIFEGCHTGNSA